MYASIQYINLYKAKAGVYRLISSTLVLPEPS